MPAVFAPIERRRAVIRVNWAIATACAVVLTLVFAAQNVGVLGGRQPYLTRLGAAGLGWGLWLTMVPLVFAIAAVGATPANVTPYLFVRIVLYLNFAGDVLRYGLIAAVYHVLAYNAEARSREVSEARMAQRLAEARLESLEARLQPHFLFNALNAIAALTRKNPASAAVMIGQLSDLLRAALAGDAAREVTLADELRLLEQYVAIQRTRFCDRLRFSVDVSTEALAAYVPQMILQPIVENAIQHGIGPREGPGAVTLSAVRDRATLRVIVRDDGVGFGQAPASLKGSGVGLRSTRARLDHFYGDGSTFDIRAELPGGTIVTIDVPFHTDGPRSPRPVA